MNVSPLTFVLLAQGAQQDNGAEREVQNVEVTGQDASGGEIIVVNSDEEVCTSHVIYVCMSLLLIVLDVSVGVVIGLFCFAFAGGR